jgi:hypothetical protein
VIADDNLFVTGANNTSAREWANIGVPVLMVSDCDDGRATALAHPADRQAGTAPPVGSQTHTGTDGDE